MFHKTHSVYESIDGSEHILVKHASPDTVNTYYGNSVLYYNSDGVLNSCSYTELKARWNHVKCYAPYLTNAELGPLGGWSFYDLEAAMGEAAIYALKRLAEEKGDTVEVEKLEKLDYKKCGMAFFDMLNVHMFGVPYQR